MEEDYSKIPIKELVARVAKLTNTSVKDYKDVDKESLIKLLEENLSVADFSNVELETFKSGPDIPQSESEAEPTILNKFVPGEDWTDAVMSELQDNEVDKINDKKYPKTHGLRRIVQKYIGDIIKCGPIQSIGPSIQNQFTATVVYGATIESYYNLSVKSSKGESFSQNELFHPKIYEYSEIADANDKNTPLPFSLHLSATASTKAEGRCWRKILNVNICTSEEIKLKNDVSTQEVASIDFNEKPISESQIKFIKIQCERHSIALDKVLLLKGQADIALLTAQDGADLIQELTGYIQCGIPQEIKN